MGKLKKEYNFVHVLYLVSATLLLCAFLNNFLLDSTLGYSLYVGFCFFIVIISFNKKVNKQEETEKKILNSGD